MTIVENFKNGIFVHSANILGSTIPDVQITRVAAAQYGFVGDTPATVTEVYNTAHRGLVLGIGATPSNWTHGSGAGLTARLRTQSAFAASAGQGGDLIVLTGDGDGVGRKGTFSVPGAGASSEAFGLASVASGASSTAVGNAASALAASTTVMGASAQSGTSAATNGVVIGAAAANATFTGTNNVLIGSSVATALSSGILNTICGSDAGGLLTSGSRNCLYGYNTKTVVNSDGNAVGIGTSSIVSSRSVVVGATATANGERSVVLGYVAHGGTAAATAGVVIGAFAANATFTGIENVLIGNSVATALTSGTLNTICGTDAGDLLTTGSSNCLYGSDVETVVNSDGSAVGIGASSVVSNQSVVVGGGATANATNSVVIGFSADGGTTAAANGVVIGASAANATFTGTNNVLIGSSCAPLLSGGSSITIVGTNAGDLLTTGSDLCLYGVNAEVLGSGTSSCVGIGHGSIVSQQSVSIGKSATANAQDSVVIGFSAAGGTTAATNGVVIGASVANATFTGVRNVLIGSSVATALTSGTLNTICGSDAGGLLTTGSRNCLYGNNSETQAVGTADSVGIGDSVVVHTSAIVIGSGAATTASNQFVGGSSSHPTNNVYFGKGAQNAAPTSYTINGTAATGAATGGTVVLAGGSSAAGLGGAVQISTTPSTAGALAVRQDVDLHGNFIFTQGVQTSGSPTFCKFVAAAHTTLLESVEAIDIDFQLDRTVQFDNPGLIADQRAFVVRAPTYAFIAGSNIDKAATVAITGGPIAGTNATITNSYALWIQSGLVQVDGSITVTGAALTSTAKAVLLGNGYPYQNYGYVTVVAKTGGVVINYLPTATVDTVATGGFTAGVPAVSNPSAVTSGAATFAAADLIQISNAGNPANNGLFEVLSHIGTTLRIRGVGLTATVEAFTQNQFVTSAATGATIVKVGVSILRAGTDGIWESGKGNVTPISFADIVTGTVTGSGTVNRVAKFTAATVVGDSSITDTGALVTVSVPLTVPGTGANSERFGAATTAAGADSVVFGYSADGGTVLATDGVVIGANAANATFTGAFNVLIGSSVASALSSGNSNTICGAEAGDLLTTGGANCLYGRNAETQAIDTSDAVGIGYFVVVRTSSVAIGANVSCLSSDSVVIGNAAKGGTTAANFSVVIGQIAANATFSGLSNVLIGSSVATALSSGTLNTICGSDAGGLLTTGSRNCLYGNNSETQAVGTADSVGIGDSVVVHTSAIAIGSGAATTASNQFVAGSSSHPTNDVYFGKGVTNTTPTSYTIHGTDSTGAAAGGAIVIAGGTSVSGVGGAVTFQTAIGTTLATRQSISSNGDFTFTQGISTTGSPKFATWTAAAHTTLTASAEAIDIFFDLSRIVQFATGALTTQRAFVIENPTYGFVGASTITTAATFAILGAPVAGTNATITNAFSLWVQAGTSRFDGTVQMADNLFTRPEIKDYALSVTTVGTSGATETLNLEDGNVFDITMDQACTFTFSNPPASGKYGKLILILRGAFTPTFPASVDWPSGSQPTYATPSIYTFITVDGGTTWYGMMGGSAFA